MAQSDLGSPRITRRSAPYVETLSKMKNRGVVYYGDPNDPCVVLKFQESYSVVKGGLPQKPRRIVYFSRRASLPTVNGVITECSHLCARTFCIVFGHIHPEPHSDNTSREFECHPSLMQYEKDHPDFTGKVTATLAGIDCPHTPQCFWNAGRH